MKLQATRRRVRSLVFATAVAAAIAVVPTASSTGRYVDPSGDAGTAPDITGVTVAPGRAGSRSSPSS